MTTNHPGRRRFPCGVMHSSGDMEHRTVAPPAVTDAPPLRAYVTDNSSTTAAARALRVGMENRTQLTTQVEALQNASDRMRRKLWDSAAHAMYTYDMARYLDRLDLLFSIDHNGYDMHDRQYTTEDRNTYRDTMRTDIVTHLLRVHPGWVDPS